LVHPDKYVSRKHIIMINTFKFKIKTLIVIVLIGLRVLFLYYIGVGF